MPVHAGKQLRFEALFSCMWRLSVMLQVQLLKRLFIDAAKEESEVVLDYWRTESKYLFLISSS